MAEENKDVVVEPAVETVDEPVTLSPTEEKASGLGWMPKEEWVEQGRDPDDWKPAKVFLEHGDMIGKIRAQSRELEETKNALRFVNDKNKQAYEKGYQSALTELRAQKREALREGDLVRADEIEEKIEVTKEELQQVRQAEPPKPRQVDPEHEAWLARNPWYSDTRMQQMADSIAVSYIRDNNGQVSSTQVREYVEQEIKKEFPHKFPQAKTTVTGAPNPDGEGRNPGKKNTNTGLDSKLAKAKAEMTEEHRGIMKNIIRQTGMTEKQYMEMYLS
jgi:hypothetical protein